MSAKDIVTGAKTTKKTTAKKPPTKTAAARDVEARENKKRAKRRHLGATKKLVIPEDLKEEGYTYRFIMDRPERVHMFRGAWWEPVMDHDGQPLRVPSGGGEYLTAYKVESKYYEEDRELNRKKNINLLEEKAKLERDRHSMEYVPEGHEAVVKISN